METWKEVPDLWQNLEAGLPLGDSMHNCVQGGFFLGDSMHNRVQGGRHRHLSRRHSVQRDPSRGHIMSIRTNKIKIKSPKEFGERDSVAMLTLITLTWCLDE